MIFAVLWKNKFPEQFLSNYITFSQPLVRPKNPHEAEYFYVDNRTLKDAENLIFMPAIELTLNIFLLAGIIFLSAALGFMIQRIRISLLRNKILELEKEMLNSHSEILELQRTKAILEQDLQASRIPVIPLNAGKEESADNRKSRRKR